MSSCISYLDNAEQMIAERRPYAAAQFLLLACRDSGFSTEIDNLMWLLRTRNGHTIAGQMLKRILHRLRGATISGLAG